MNAAPGSFFLTNDQTRALFESNPLGIVYQNANGEITAANIAAQRILGLDLSQLQGRTSIDPRWHAIHPDGSDFPGNEHPSMQALRSGETVQNVTMGVFNPRTEKTNWININAVPQFLNQGEIPYMVFATFEDITERIQAETALRKSEAMLSTIFKNSPIGLEVYDRHGILRQYNRKVHEMFGSSQEELIGKFNLRDDPNYQYPDVWERLNKGEEVIHDIKFDFSKAPYKTEKTGIFYYHIITTPVPESVSSEIGYIMQIIDITERKRAEQNLQQWFDFIPECVGITKPGGYFVEINHEWEHVLGYSKEEILSQPFVNFVHPDDRGSTNFEMIDQQVHGKETVYFENRYRAKDGQYHWFAWNVAPALESNHHIAAARDITERKLAEQKLHESEERYRLISENSADVIWVLDPVAGKFKYVSPSVQSLRGYTPEEVMAQPVSEALTPESLKLVSEAIGRDLPTFIKNGKGTLSRVTEVDQPRKDGSIVHTEVTTTYLFNSMGQVEIIGVSRDITQRKHAEESLRQSEASLRKAQSVAHAGSWVLHVPTNRMECSEEIFQIYGIQKETITDNISDEINRRIHPEDLPLVQQARKAIFDEKNLPSLEYRIIAPDGTTRTVWTEIGEFTRDENGQPLKLSGIVQDITERKLIEEELRKSQSQLEERVKERTAELVRVNKELEHANHAKDEFLASISHELRSPLTGILGLTESLQMKVYGQLNERQARALRHIDTSGHHLLELINDILDLAKIEAGKFEASMQNVNPDEVCKASLSFINQQAHKKNVTVKYQSDPEARSMFAEPRRLKQILVNLLSNAVKFTPDDGQVMLSVRTDPEQNMIHFSVSDNGIGISPEDLKRLFAPFTQVDSRLSRQYEGTGLGLVLVKRLVDMHKGSVQVESEPGKGSRFTVSLPWKPEQEDEIDISGDNQRTGNTEANPGDSRGLLLLADDNESNMEVMNDFLQFLGFTTMTASNGREALEKAKEHYPQLILMDIQMPELDGLEAIKQLRADERFSSTPIIALTALAMANDRESCLAAGANAYMSKPVTLMELADLIDTLIKKNRQST